MSEAGHATRHALGAAHAELMGVEFDSFDREREEITPRGSVQGGPVAGFLDDVRGWAHVWATDHEEAPLNLDLTMTIVRPVPAGPLVGKGRVIQRGRKAIFLEGELFDPAGKLLARATSTAIPTPRPTGEK